MSIGRAEHYSAMNSPCVTRRADAGLYQSVSGQRPCSSCRQV